MLVNIIIGVVAFAIGLTLGSAATANMEKQKRIALLEEKLEERR